MNYKRVLTIQDISCFGQCSLTVALPIISSAGLETVILPSAVLSTHTGGFKGFTFRDLTDDIPEIENHWKNEGICFDAIYTGYLGSIRQINQVIDIIYKLSKPDAAIIVDPAMADNGKLYGAFNQEYVEEMKKLAFSSDITLPNITEAAFLTGIEYKTEYNQDYIKNIFDKMCRNGSKTIVLTGVSYNEKSTGVAVLENGNYSYYEHKKIPVSSHGTGDVYASAFVGAYMNGKSVFDSAAIAADYTLKCIENTVGDDHHKYGVKFEPVLPYYINRILN